MRRPVEQASDGDHRARSVGDRVVRRARRDLVLTEGHQAANLERQPAHEGPEAARPELIRIALEGSGARRRRVHHVDEAVADAEVRLGGASGSGTP